MCPRRGNDPASGHPRAHQPPLGRGTSPPAWDGRLDAPGQRRRHLPSSAWTRRREVKQGKSGGSVGTTDQGKGKGRSVVRPMGTVAYGGKGQGKGKGRGEGRLGQGGRGRSKGGEKLMGTTAYGGKGSKGRAVNGDRPVGAASCRRDHHTMASCQNPPPRAERGTPLSEQHEVLFLRLLEGRGTGGQPAGSPAREAGGQGDPSQPSANRRPTAAGKRPLQAISPGLSTPSKPKRGWGVTGANTAGRAPAQGRHRPAAVRGLFALGFTRSAAVTSPGDEGKGRASAPPRGSETPGKGHGRAHSEDT